MRAATDLAENELDALQLAVVDGVAEGREAIRDLRDSGVEFDGIVCASDSLGLGALLMVGPDVPVIGYDNTPVAEAVGLSSVEQNLEEVATGALELVMGDAGSDVVDWEQSDAARHRLVTPSLISRNRRIT